MLNNKVIHPVLIIGAGPAGMTAAIYLKRANVTPILVDKDAPGGKLNITQKVENYPGYTSISGPDLAFKMFEQVRELGINIDYADVKKISKVGNIFKIETTEEPLFAETVIVATGTAERKLKIPGEARYTNKGVSYCAVCDGSLYKDLPIAVIGGGNSALEESLFLTKFVGKVYLVHRRQGFRADDMLVSQVKENPLIELVLDAIPVEVLGDGTKVTGLSTKNVLTGEDRILKVDAVFPLVGSDAQSDMLEGLDVKDDKGYVLVDENMETKVSGLYSIGDLNAKVLRQITTATADGSIAGIAVSKRLRTLKK